jgi:imidazolonepropionase-like amidohydrolase
LPDSLIAAHAFRIMKAMLHRGFTTVRDVGGADYGLARAVELGLVEGPRLVICGKALSQTGGHTDYRGRYQDWDPAFFTNRLGSLGRICDGVDAVRRAVRENLKAGADFIKIMANGGVSSPTDPIAVLAYSTSEIEAVVEEARNGQTYVSAHLYTDEAIRRAVSCGVHSIEHANMIELQSARMITERGGFVVPTLVTYDQLKKRGADAGMPAESVAKIDDVHKAGLRSLEILREAGTAMAYGTDLLGDMHDAQADEFLIRREVIPAVEIIASATSVAARLLRMQGQIGCIAPGAYADLIVVDRDPLADLSALTEQGRHMALVMKAGRIVRNALS